jgi:hypothetical protein
VERLARNGNDTDRSDRPLHEVQRDGPALASAGERSRAERHVDGSIAGDADVFHVDGLHATERAVDDLGDVSAEPRRLLETVLATVVVLAMDVMRIDVTERAREQYRRTACSSLEL